MSRKKEHSEEVKAQVLASLLSGESITSVAHKYKIPPGTIKSWKNRQDATPVALVATTKREEIGGLLIGFLEKSIRSLSVQVEQFGDKTWLQNQSAADLTELFGSLTDRTFRLLEALEGGAPDPEPRTPPDTPN